MNEKLQDNFNKRIENYKDEVFFPFIILNEVSEAKSGIGQHEAY